MLKINQLLGIIWIILFYIHLIKFFKLIDSILNRSLTTS